MATTNVIDASALPSLDYSAEAFSKARYDLRYNDAGVLKHYPVAGTKNSSLTFVLKGMKGPFVWDLSKLTFSAYIRLVSNEGKTPAKNLMASVCNNTLKSLIKTLSISIDNKNVMCLNDYGLLSYINARLTCSKSDMDTWMTAGNWHLDTDFDKNDTSNEGFKARREEFGDEVVQPGGQTEFLFSETPTFFITTLDVTIPPPPMLPNGIDVILV